MPLPKKKKALKDKGLYFSPSSKVKMETDAKIVARVKMSLHKLKRQKTKQGRNQYQLLTRSIVGKYAVEHSLRKALDIKWEYWTNMSEIERNGPETIKRSDAMANETVINIERFYENESVTLPTKKSVGSKTLKQKRVLIETLQQVHKQFLKENPTMKVSLSHFRKMRPKEVLTVKQQRFYSCLCEYCLNVHFKIEVLNQALKSHNININVDSKYHAIELSLCEKEKDAEFHQLKCYERKCDACGTKKLEKYLECLVVADNGKGTYNWKRWKLGIVGAAADGKETKRQILAENVGTLIDLIDEFVEEVGFLANHLFVARWQYIQFNKICKSVPENWLVTIADYSENYRCVHQDEIQSAYYSYSQATVFPMIAYYRCPDCKDSTVQESMVFISSDLVHDAMAADQYTKRMADHVKGHIDFSHEVQFTDGCSSQFKSKLPFQHLSETKTHHMERAYFGSRHGKGPSDALGGIVKKQAEMYVKSRKGTVQNAKALFDFCNANLTMHTGSKCEHKKRVFFFHDNINRDKKPQNLKTLKGTQTVHSVRGVEPGIVEARHLSCFCKVCIGEETDSQPCCNESYVGEWKVHDIIKGKQSEMVKENKKQDKGKGKRGTCKRRTGKENGKPKIEQPESLSQCSTLKKLKRCIGEMHFEKLPPCTPKSFCLTGKIVDKNSLALLPKDIPLTPKEELFPAKIIGDGNCLPRSASVLVYGTEDKHKEIRERIVCELVENENLYLDNKRMTRGKNEFGNDNVPKTFASYSSLYMGRQRLNKQSIKKLYEKEVLEVSTNGKYMGLWQLACLANVMSCPVVSVCPTYGMHTVRHDMHRIFYPFKEQECDRKPVYIMWSNINGSNLPEVEFSVNHFVVLMPLSNRNSIDSEISLDLDISEGTKDELLNNSISDAISNLEMDMYDTMLEDNDQISKPDIHETNPETTETYPETTETYPEITETYPKIHESTPESIETSQETTETYPESHEINPEITRTFLDFFETYPEITATYQDIHETNPENTEKNLEATETYPKIHESTPDTTETSPEIHESTPEIHESNPETIESYQEITETSPEIHKSNPETTETSPEIHESTPETTETSPEITESTKNTTETSPEIHESTPDTTETSPEIHESNPETTESYPEITETSPEIHESTPETTESYPEITATYTEVKVSDQDNLELPLEVQSTSEAFRSYPETSESNPESTETYTETSETHPETTELNSMTLLSNNDNIELSLENQSSSETPEPYQGTTEQYPKTTETYPEIKVSNQDNLNLLEVHSTSETFRSYPETSESNPETAETYTETTEPSEFNITTETHQKPRYCIGTFLKVMHGKNKYPAVVVEPPEKMDDAADHGLWAKYFSRSRRLWMLDEICYI